MRILIRGPVDPWNGYGRDLIGLTTALLDEGVDVSLWPTGLAPGLPRRITDLLSRPLAPPYDVLLWYAPPAEITPWGMYGWARTQLGWTMWERTPFTSANLPWWDAANPDLQRGRVWSRRHLDRDTTAKGWLDALIVTCPMNVEAFGHVEKHLPIEVIPPGVDVDNYPEQQRDHGGGPVRFGWIGVPSARKNLEAMLAAWREFRATYPAVDAILEIKTSGIGAGVVEATHTPDVTVHRDTWSTEQLAAWYSSLDCLVSTSRGEGMNKPAVEAMSTGAAVIAPYWGGHVNWLHPDTGYEVTYELVESPFEDDTTDCAVDHRDLVDTLALVADHRDDCGLKGKQAANVVRASMTWRHAAQRLVRTAARYC